MPATHESEPELSYAEADVLVYARGLTHCSVCAPGALSGEDVELHTSFINPTGIPAPWRISSDPTFSGGQPNPCPCERDPSRLHHLMVC